MFASYFWRNHGVTPEWKLDEYTCAPLALWPAKYPSGNVRIPGFICGVRLRDADRKVFSSFASFREQFQEQSVHGDSFRAA